MASNQIDGTETLFKNLKIFVSQRVPSRHTFLQAIVDNGGEKALLEKNADIVIADHLKKDLAPPGSYSYKWLEQCISEGDLVDTEPHRIGPVRGESRPVAAGRPAKQTKTPYTAEDDHLLYEWVMKRQRQGDKSLGNEMYKALEQENNRHTWQSWRDRWVKYISQNEPPRPTANTRPEQVGSSTDARKGTRESEAKIGRSTSSAQQIAFSALERARQKARAQVRQSEPYRREESPSNSTISRPQVRYGEPSRRLGSQQGSRQNSTPATAQISRREFSRGEGYQQNSRPSATRVPQGESSRRQEPTRNATPVHNDIGTSDASRPFTKDEHDFLLVEAKDIEEIFEEGGDEAWEELAASNPNHTASEWRAYYQEHVQPVLRYSQRLSLTRDRLFPPPPSSASKNPASTSTPPHRTEQSNEPKSDRSVPKRRLFRNGPDELDNGESSTNLKRQRDETGWSPCTERDGSSTALGKRRRIDVDANDGDPQIQSRQSDTHSEKPIETIRVGYDPEAEPEADTGDRGINIHEDEDNTGEFLDDDDKENVKMDSEEIQRDRSEGRRSDALEAFSQQIDFSLVPPNDSYQDISELDAQQEPEDEVPIQSQTGRERPSTPPSMFRPGFSPDAQSRSDSFLESIATPSAQIRSEALAQSNRSMRHRTGNSLSPSFTRHERTRYSPASRHAHMMIDSQRPDAYDEAQSSEEEEPPFKSPTRNRHQKTTQNILDQDTFEPDLEIIRPPVTTVTNPSKRNGSTSIHSSSSAPPPSGQKRRSQPQSSNETRTRNTQTSRDQDTIDLDLDVVRPPVTSSVRVDTSLRHPTSGATHPSRDQSRPHPQSSHETRNKNTQAILDQDTIDLDLDVVRPPVTSSVRVDRSQDRHPKPSDPETSQDKQRSQPRTSNKTRKKNTQAILDQDTIDPDLEIVRPPTTSSARVNGFGSPHPVSSAPQYSKGKGKQRAPPNHVSKHLPFEEDDRSPSDFESQRVDFSIEDIQPIEDDIDALPPPVPSSPPINFSRPLASPPRPQKSQANHRRQTSPRRFPSRSLSRSPSPTTSHTGTESQIESFITFHVNQGHTVEDVLSTLKQTTMDSRLAEKLLIMKLRGQTIPKRMKGVWSERDDRELQGGDPDRLGELERFHEKEAFNRRWEFLTEEEAEGEMW